MPRRDGTGPMGMGPMTGRGYRRQFNETGIPGYLRNSFSGNIPEMDEKTYLTNQEIVLSNQLKLVKERLADMDDSKE